MVYKPTYNWGGTILYQFEYYQQYRMGPPVDSIQLPKLSGEKNYGLW